MRPLLFVSFLALTTDSPAQKPVADLQTTDLEILHPLDTVTFPPPPPPVVKPLPVMKELKRLERGLGKERMLTTRWVEPIEARYHTPAPTIERPALTEEELAELQELASRETWLSFSAMVVDESVSLVGWRYQGESYQCWSNVNWGELAPVSRFRIGEQFYSVWLGWSRTKREWMAEGQGTGLPPEDFPERPPQFEPIGEVPEEALAPVIAMHQIYAEEGKRLAKIYEKRQRARKEWAEWHAANPRQPRDIEVILWPSRTARFMTKPIPEQREKMKARLAAQRKPADAVFNKIAAEQDRWSRVPTLTVADQ